MFDNRLVNLPVEILFQIADRLTIFDLKNLESSGLFELDEDGISDKIQAAFEQLREINVESDDYDEELTRKLVMRCGSGLKSLKVKFRRRWSEGFLTRAYWNDKHFITYLFSRCPNIERFSKSDFEECEFGAKEMGVGHYIRNVKESKLVDVDPTYLPFDVLPRLFNRNLKVVRFSELRRFIDSMEELNRSYPEFGCNVRQIIAEKECLCEAWDSGYLDVVKKLVTFFPHLLTFRVKASKGMFCDYGELIYTNEKMNDPDFVHQLELLAEYTNPYLPYINLEREERFDSSSIVKIEPHEEKFDPATFNQLKNLQSLRLKGNKLMCDFAGYLSNSTFKSLRRLDFTDLELDADAFAAFEKILSTGRFFVCSIVKTFAINVHSSLIPLLGRYCRNIKTLDIELEPENVEHCEKLTVTLTAGEMELLNSIGIGNILSERPRHWKHRKPYQCNVLSKNQTKNQRNKFFY